jgi:hypothetical protein
MTGIELDRFRRKLCPLGIAMTKKEDCLQSTLSIVPHGGDWRVNGFRGLRVKT